MNEAASAPHFSPFFIRPPLAALLAGVSNARTCTMASVKPKERPAKSQKLGSLDLTTCTSVVNVRLQFYPLLPRVSLPSAAALLDHHTQAPNRIGPWQGASHTFLRLRV